MAALGTTFSILLVRLLLQLPHSLLKPSEKHRPRSCLPSPPNLRHSLNLCQTKPVKDEVEHLRGKAAPTLLLILKLSQADSPFKVPSSLHCQHIFRYFLCLIQEETVESHVRRLSDVF